MEFKYTQTVNNAVAQQFFDGKTDLTVTVKNAQLLAQLTNGKKSFRTDPPLLDHRIVADEQYGEARNIITSYVEKQATATKSTDVTIDLADSDLTDKLQALAKRLDEQEQKYQAARAEQGKRDAERNAIYKKVDECIRDLAFEDIYFQHFTGSVQLYLKQTISDIRLATYNEDQFLNITGKDIFAAVTAHLQEQNEKQKRRITNLEGYLNKLIRAASSNALVNAGLVQPIPDGEEPDEELPQEVQEALHTVGLDDC